MSAIEMLQQLPQVGEGKAPRYQKTNLGRGRRPTNLAGPYFLRYSHAVGTRPWEPLGDDFDAAIGAQRRKQAYFEALDANVPVMQDLGESGRTKINSSSQTISLGSFPILYFIGVNGYANLSFRSLG